MSGEVKRKVFVSGCFDLLHSGHVRFLEKAASYGDLYVGIGSDKTVMKLKSRKPFYTEQERQYLIQAIKGVTGCFINSGSGDLDFIDELKVVSPHFFIVNEDGHTPAKAELCRSLGIEYVVLARDIRESLPARSTTVLRKKSLIPYRLDLAGGWLDQPFVSKHAPGPVLTVSLEPAADYRERSGLASSTRERAIELWKMEIPPGDPVTLARILFSYDNPPGTTQFSGSQDAIGIVLPGLNYLRYNGDFWPSEIRSVNEEEVLRWLESHLFLYPVVPRPPNFRVFSRRMITTHRVKRLAIAANNCWSAILDRNLNEFGRRCRESFEAQIAMFPDMINATIRRFIEQHEKRVLGWKLTGAGGGGYLVMIAEQTIPGAMQIRIRRQKASKFDDIM